MDNKKSSLDDFFSKIEILFEKEKSKRDILQKQLDDEVTNKELIKENIDKTFKKRVFLQKCSTKGKNQAELMIENVNNRMLKYVFPYSINFDIEQKVKGGATWVNCYTEIKKDNGNIIRREPTEGGGLGVVDAISIATRNVFLNEIDKTNKAPIFFDEPGKFVSNEYISKIAEYLQHTQSYYNRQMFLITHNDFIATIGDKSFLVSLNENGYSKVEEM